MASAKETITKLAVEADITVNGNRPWDITVHDERFFNRVLSGGSIALGESYMDGWWDAPSVDEFMTHILGAKLHEKVKPTLSLLLTYLKAQVINLQSKSRATIVVEKHYDLSNELYASFLDPYNQYTCGYFKDTDDLNVAQEQKLDLICRKLQLTKDDRVLDIGCGWGGFAKFAAERYGVHVTGITISKEQLTYAKEFTKGLPVEIRFQDYRDLNPSTELGAGEQFDKVLICGMIEHVGYKNYRTLMETVRRSLSDNGLFLLHTIGYNFSTVSGDAWMDKYIFPNGMAPSTVQISKACEHLFTMEDWHNFGTYYDQTLMAWFKNFDAAWPKLKAKYDERFYRMWKYYLLACAGVFRSRDCQLWQIVLSKNGVVGGYRSVR